MKPATATAASATRMTIARGAVTSVKTLRQQLQQLQDPDFPVIRDERRLAGAFLALGRFTALRRVAMAYLPSLRSSNSLIRTSWLCCAASSASSRASSTLRRRSNRSSDCPT